MKSSQTLVSKQTQRTIARAVLAFAAASSLSACYVTPYNQYPNGVPSVTPLIVVPSAPSAQVLQARLYPSNDTAAPFGVLTASVTNQLNGHGELVVVQGEELFRGEATRDPRSTSSGTANGAGTRGGYMSCAYTMNSTTQGRGNCRFSNGATYTFHLGQ